ncbi:tRNA-dihydrouridine(47) synthase [NAD(P)(+)]-like [Amphibalanus amphitrite]|uniref:tRNA-dihydrouridine(47) synthase [NAD(P)(+)]-like n=1 Tax=Amphibalanus amphitrite TaxID=1232801 RepID=UPI001C91C646|nr:tRNA-dihydrouridine(47) synthase [NAD(P)(+)]-like [Amphibalanus amphitrite]
MADSNECKKDPVYRPGEAAIKAEFLLPINKDGAGEPQNEESKSDLSEDVTAKRIKLSDDGAPETSSADNAQPVDDGQEKEAGQQKEKQRGRNKQRPGRARQPPSEKLCPVLKDVLASEPEPRCTFPGQCHFLHDPAAYLAKKPADLGPRCYMYEEHGRCPSGLTCRFGASHTTPEHRSSEGDPEKWAAYQALRPTRNALTKDVQRQLWKRRYDFSVSNAAVQRFDRRPSSAQRGGQRQRPGRRPAEGTGEAPPAQNGVGPDAPMTTPETAPAAAAGSETTTTAATDPAVPTDASVATPGATAAPAPAQDAVSAEGPAVADANTSPAPGAVSAAVGNTTGPVDGRGDSAQSTVCSEKPIGSHSDTDFVKPRPAEKKKVDWQDQLYLAPLTTVGNLPFRRLCRRLGADITCGEMAMATNLLQGAQAEWALVRRHHSEKVFGAQICGNNPGVLTRCAQLLNETCELDFIDINLGCPIDLVYQQGGGSAMMRKRSMLENTCRSISSVIDIPLTLKMRTGVFRGANIAHDLITSAADWGVDMVTLHGRSREQRYTKLADWQYVAECSRAAHPLPLYGNGDVLSWEEYEAKKAASGVAGIMVARGALIKPWLFTEIKERRTWDIRSSERLDLLKEYTNYGLEHWGSDTEGVEKTRRFLLEWLSFLYRYIPAGLLERPPQRINERPPAFRGRDDLETLMASGNCRDWVTISEMLLGKVPDSFEFLPKHKANSYG